MPIKIRNRVNPQKLAKRIIRDLDPRDVKELSNLLVVDMDDELVKRNLEAGTIGNYSRDNNRG